MHSIGMTANVDCILDDRSRRFDHLASIVLPGNLRLFDFRFAVRTRSIRIAAELAPLTGTGVGGFQVFCHGNQDDIIAFFELFANVVFVPGTKGN